MRINLIISILLISCSTGVFAQTGAPTNSANENAVLDLNNTTGSASKGLLLPNIALTSTSSPSPLSGHVKGMHIYNTTNTAQVPAGEYYNDGTQWIRVSNGNESWSTTGNTGTSAAVNGLGTTDNNDLVFKTNNIERMRVLAAGNVLLGATSLPTGGANTKLSITHNSSTPALVIKDGTECAGCVLTSDANGVGKWAPIEYAKKYSNTGAQTFAGPGLGTITRTPGTGGTTLNTNTPITITKAGNYIVSLSCLMRTEGVSSTEGVTSAYVSVWKNGVLVDELEYFFSFFDLSGQPLDDFNFANDWCKVGFSVKLIALGCAAGDLLTIKIAPSIGNSIKPKNWYLDAAGNANVRIFKV